MTFATKHIHEVEDVAGACVLEPADCSWGDVDLPARAEKTFREIYRRANAGRQVSALLSGPAGSGKTRAASLIAGELNRQVVHVRLSALHSRPLADTEENLNRVFLLADPASVVLLFDEADTVFAKRNNSVDGPYAGLEQRFLERVENYDGLAILATHHCKRIDPLLVHRLHFAIRI